MALKDTTIDSHFATSHKANSRESRRGIAEGTLLAIKRGSYPYKGTAHDLREKLESSTEATRYHSPSNDSATAAWNTRPWPQPPATTTPVSTDISILEISTLDGARLLHSDLPTPTPTSSPRKIGILNFASATKPGGGFLTGAQAQEESIARSSTLYPSLTTKPASEFYKLHTRDAKDGYYSHAMIYSPDIVLFRDDTGEWCAPVTVDVLTSAAVNAGVVRNSLRGRIGGRSEEERVRNVMKERMGRLLGVFEKEGVTDLVLGSFGTGVFKNDVGAVARMWAELITAEGARFEGRFRRVVFAVLGSATFEEFMESFERTRRGEAVVEKKKGEGGRSGKVGTIRVVAM